VKIVAGTGSNSTAHAIHLSQHAAELGADGLLIVAPYYNKPSQEGLFQHYAAIAKSVKLPVMVYNIPGRCGVEISAETIKRMHEAHANISSVKHATGSVGGAADLLAACPTIEIVSGDDPITLPLMSIGAVGVVSVLSNLAPRSVKRLTQAALAGDWKTALDAHQKMHALGKALLSLDTNPMPIKTACAMKGWCAEEFRLPMCPLSPENRAKLAKLLDQHPLD
jgi:4-hydroxy-tetrahydrodipicolinate synthase